MILKPFRRQLHLDPPQTAMRSDLSCLVDKAKDSVGVMLGLSPESMRLDMLFRLCDVALIQAQVSGDIEVYKYREGHQRGMFASFLVVMVALVVRLITPGAAVEISASRYELTRPMLAGLLILSILGTALGFFRYRDIRRRRFTRAIIGFLLLQARPMQSGERRTPQGDVYATREDTSDVGLDTAWAGK